MATIIAHMDNYDTLWESEELKDLLENGRNEEAVEWLKKNCPCDESDAEDVEMICDGACFDIEGYKLLYSDFGFIERIDLIRK